MRALAVDDDPLILEVLKNNFEEMGIKSLACAESGAVALAIVKKATTPFDVILLDIEMPGMDGIEVCRKIRMIPEYNSTPILMVTTVTKEESVREAFTAGATDYVCKPVKPLDLAARIQSVTHLLRERRRAESNFEAAQSLKVQIEQDMKMTREKGLKVDFVPNMIDKLEMENYILQLSRLQISRTQVYAFGIREFNEIYDRTTAFDLYYTIGDVASALQSCFSSEKSLLSYCGAGRFVVVSRESDKENRYNIAQIVQKAVNELELVYNNGSPCKVTMVTGEPVQASFWSMGSSLRLMERALNSLDMTRGGHDTYAETRKYKSLLRECLDVA
ncbi:MAG: response regulator [Rhodobacteraceae bacterium]|nr:response regulator [Paracoccaceae bacterium]